MLFISAFWVHLAVFFSIYVFSVFLFYNTVLVLLSDFSIYLQSCNILNKFYSIHNSALVAAGDNGMNKQLFTCVAAICWRLGRKRIFGVFLEPKECVSDCKCRSPRGGANSGPAKRLAKSEGSRRGGEKNKEKGKKGRGKGKEKGRENPSQPPKQFLARALIQVLFGA